MAAMAARKGSSSARPPPPPIAQSTAPISIYDDIEAPSTSPSRDRHHQPARGGVPPVPLANEIDYVQPDDEAEEYEDAGYLHGGRDNRGLPPERYYLEAQDQRYPQDEYYADTAPPNRNSYHGQGLGPQDHYQMRYGTSPAGHYSQDIYETPPFEDDSWDHRNYPNDYPPARRPVDRRESRKKMGVAIVQGLNTARVKEVKQRLRPAFGPDELIDSIERKSTSTAAATDDDLDPIDVSRLTVAERMKLIEAKAASQKPGPPPTFPKPRPKSIGTGAGQNPGSPSSSAPRVDVPPSRSEPWIGAGSPPSVSPPRSSSRPSSQIALDDGPWFFGNCDQHKCEEKLHNLNKEGAFIIRISKKGEARNQPYTLCVFHENDIYNLMIRQKMNQKYAVGSEKPGEPEFGSLADLVKFHADIPIEVVSKTKSGRTTGIWLTMSPLK